MFFEVWDVSDIYYVSKNELIRFTAFTPVTLGLEMSHLVLDLLGMWDHKSSRHIVYWAYLMKRKMFC